MNKSTLVVVALLVCVFAYVMLMDADSSDADSEYSGNCGDDVKYDFDPATGTLKITCDGAMTDYDDSESVPWASYQAEIQSVVFSGSVTTIGAYAFANCTALASFTIPDSATTVGKYAFSGCISLTSITVPSSVTSIGNDAFDGDFYGIDGITKLDPTAEKLAGHTFKKVENKWYTIVSGQCGDHATYEFDSSSGTLAISGSGKMFEFTDSTSVPWHSYRAYIKSVGMTGSVTTIGNYAFQECSKLESVTIPDSVTIIGSNAFDYCSELTSVTISKTVTTIGDYAFNGCSKLASLIIPESVETIGSNAFMSCSKLTSIAIPGKVKSLGSTAFAICYDLESVTIQGSIASIGSSAFYKCSKLTSVTLPDSVTSIGENAFASCESLTALTFLDSVESIGDYAFTNCKSLTTLAIPDSVQTIGRNVFYNCTSLTSLTIPSSVKSIGLGAFDGYFYGIDGITKLDPTAEKLAGHTFKKIDEKWFRTDSGECGDNATYEFDSSSGTLTLSGSGKMFDFKEPSSVPWHSYRAYIKSVGMTGSVESIGNYAFQNCAAITSVTFSDSVTEIGNYAFQNCTGLSSVDIPDKVTTIGESAFNGCSSLASMTLGDSVEEIGDLAFYGCSGLHSIAIPGSVKTIGSNAFEGIFIGFDGETEIALTAENMAGYKFDMIDGKWYISDSGECGDYVSYEFNSSTGILSIFGSGAMSSYSSVSYAPWYSYGENVKSIKFDGSITSIGSYAFYHCTSFTSITIPGSVTSIELDAFYGCESLGSLDIPDSVTTIGKYAFSRCTALESVKIPASVTSLGYQAFSICTSLKYITVDADNANYCSVNGVIFNIDKSELIQYPVGKTDETYSIPDSVGSIGTAAFAGCKSLAELTIGSSVETIGHQAFAYCTSIKSVNILASVKTIGEAAFAGCESLVSVTLSDSVEKIGDFTFSGCTSLTSIAIPGSVKSIGSGAFDGKFYDYDGISELQLVAENLKGYTFRKTGDNWYKYDSGQCGVNAYYEFDSYTGTFSITGSGNMYDYDYPSKAPWNSYLKYIKSVIVSKSITSLGNCAFEGCISLISVSIPDTVTSIGDKMFQNCSSLTSVTVPSSITSIGNNSFNGCSKLTSMAIPSSVTTIGDNSFRGCTSLISVTISDSLKTLGNNVFDGVFHGIDGKTEIEQTAENLKGHTFKKIGDSWFTFVLGKCGEEVYFEFDSVAGKLSITGSGPMDDYDYASKAPWSSFIDYIDSVRIGESVSTVGAYAFHDCSRLTSVTIGDNVGSIGDYAFYGCTALGSVTIGKSVAVIGDSAFQDCSGLTSVTIPGSVTDIGASAFQDCSGLVLLSIDGSAASIGFSAFSGCTSLASVTLGDSVTSIAYAAFEYCTSLVSIDIPASVGSLIYSAFYGCTSLKAINVDGKNANYSSAEGVLFDQKMTELILYPVGKTDSAYTIPESVTTIGPYAFVNCGHLTSVTLGKQVETIGYSAFSGCASLTSVTIPDSVKEIGRGAFSDCTSLTSVTLSDSLKEIAGYLFVNCTSLTTVTIPGSVTEIGDCAFMNCFSLTSVTFGNSLESVSPYAFDDDFYDFDCITVLDKTAENLKGSTFLKIGDKWIKHVYSGNCGDKVTFAFDLDRGILTIEGSGMMSDFTEISMPWNPYKDSIKSVIVTGSVGSIGSNAFVGCSSLTSVTIGDSVATVGSGAFGNCSSLNRLTLPISADCYGTDHPAFEGCVNIDEIVLTKGTGVWTTSDNAPWKITGADLTVTVSEGVGSIGDSAFASCDRLKAVVISDTSP